MLGPLGMNSSGLARQGIGLPQAAKGYQRRGGQIVDAGPVDPFLAFSAGGLYSTPADLALWENVFYGDAVLSPESRALLSSAPSNAYFCGQRFDRRPVGLDRTERDIVFHGGRIRGFNSLLLRIPQDRVFIVLLNNTDSTRLETMAAGLMDVLYGRGFSAPRRSLAEECRAAQKEKGVEAAIRDLRAIRRREGGLTDPEPEELQLNAFGYELLGQKRLTDALAVFSFAAEQFPNSWNACDSLAEAQAALGRNEEAIKSYAKSLELNPANKNALEQIQKLKKDPRRSGDPKENIMTTMKTFIKARPLPAYFVLAYAISWGGGFAVLGPKFFRGEAYQLSDTILALLVMLLGPCLSGFMLTRTVDGKIGSRALFSHMRRWRVGYRWYFMAVLTFPILIMAVLSALTRLVSPEFAPSFAKLGIIYGLAAGYFEEIGWMGFAYPKLRLKYSIFKASLILGVLHGVWHGAAGYLGSSQTLGGYWLPHFLLMWCFAMVALRVLIAWIYENTKSLLLAQLAHASSTGFLVVLSPSPITPAGETFWYGLYGLVLWALAAVIIVKNKDFFPGPPRSSREMISLFL